MNTTTNNNQHVIINVLDEAIKCNYTNIVELIINGCEDVDFKSLAFKIYTSKDIPFLESMMKLALNCRNKQIIAALRNNLEVRNMSVNNLLHSGKHDLVPFFELIGYTHILVLLNHYATYPCSNSPTEQTVGTYSEEESVDVLSYCLKIYNERNNKKYMFCDSITICPDDIASTLIKHGNLELFKCLSHHRKFTWGTKCALIAEFCSLDIEDSKKNELFDVIMLDDSYHKEGNIEKSSTVKLMTVKGITKVIFLELQRLSGLYSDKSYKTKVDGCETTSTKTLVSLKYDLISGTATLEDLKELDGSHEGRQLLTTFGLLN